MLRHISVMQSPPILHWRAFYVHKKAGVTRPVRYK